MRRVVRAALCEGAIPRQPQIIAFLRIECAMCDDAEDYDYAAQAQEKNILSREGRPRNGSRTRGQSQTFAACPRQEEQAGKA
jgi:hypothetical protein